MEDALLPFDGPGRYAVNGNFVLSEIELRASAATNIYWTNTLGGNWSNPANWSPNRLPTAVDHAHIVASGTYTVLQNVSATLLSLTLGGGTGTQTVANSAVTLTPASGTVNANGVLDLGNGTLGGTNVIHGTWKWVGGALDASARVMVMPSGVLNVTGTGTKFWGGVLTNAGTVTWTNTGAISFGSSGALYNLAGAIFDVRSDAPLNGSGGTFVQNAGTFRKSLGSGTNLIYPSFNNSGTVEVLTGTLSFNGGGTNTALFSLGNGAAIQNPSSFTFANGSQLTGAGTNRWTGGTITLNGDLNAANLELSGATVAGTGMLSVSNLNFFSGSFDGTNTVSGVANWIGGTIPSTARLTIATNGVLNLSGAADKFISGMLTNAGLVVWTGAGRLYLDGPGAIYNLPSGVFDVQNNSLLINQFISPSAAFHNAGLFRKSAGTGTNFLTRVNFNNSGTVELRTGTLAIPSGGTNSGTFDVAAGATLLISSDYTFASGNCLSSCRALFFRCRRRPDE